MPHPLAVFDLEDNADERAVKRAYARRLKVTRPDEDAAAFQALNEAYQMALAYIRWRDAQEEEGHEDEGEEAEGEDAEASDQTPALGPASDPMDTPSEPAQPTYVTLDPAEITLLETPQEYVFSVVDFVAQMRSGGHYVNPNRFRAWIRERMRDWPITAKPAFAHAIICHVLENGLYLHPDIYDVLIEELGLDDVASHSVDPLEIAHYRDELVRRYEAQIFTPAPPAVLRGKWHQSRWFERASVIVLCGFVLALIVMAFNLKTPIEPNTKWYKSYQTETDGPIVAQVYGADEAALNLIRSIDIRPEAEKIATLDRAINVLSYTKGLANERLMAMALYNKGHALEHDDKVRGYAAYEELQRRFRQRKDHDLAVFVAASYVNMGMEDYQHNRLEDALVAYGAVLELYGEIIEGQIGNQVDKAMFGQAEVLNVMGRKDDAVRKLDEADAKFANSPDEVLRARKGQNAKFRAKIVSGTK